MEKQFPKNVKQIGNVSDEPKIYVEDYVATYLGQLQEKAGEDPVAAVLVGEWVTVREQKAVYISGALQLNRIELKGRELILDEEVMEAAEEEQKKYFPEEMIVGWCLIVEGHPLGLIKETARIHEKYFKKEHSIFVWKDTLNEEEIYYAYKYGELMQMGGYYIYYERNPQMQNYMIGTRRQIGVTPSEVVEDRVTKDFRIAVRDQMQVKKKKERRGAGKVASVALVLLVLIMGVSLLNNFDKMKKLQDSLETISQDVNENKGNGSKNSDAKQTTITETKEIQKENASTGTENEQVAETETTTSGKEIGNEIESRTGEPEEESQGSDEEYYIVERGDTLDNISLKMYGDNSEVDAICRMNGLTDGNLIYVGQKLLLP